MITGSTDNFISEVKNKPLTKRIVGFFSKLTGKDYLIAALVLIPLILIYIYINGLNPEIKRTLKENKKIELSVDSLKSENEKLSNKILQYEENQQKFNDLINKNNDQIKANKNELLNLKRVYNEKINNAGNYNINELDSFFTERYKEYYR